MGPVPYGGGPCAWLLPLRRRCASKVGLLLRLEVAHVPETRFILEQLPEHTAVNALYRHVNTLDAAFWIRPLVRLHLNFDGR